jgi:hypothetical protein
MKTVNKNTNAPNEFTRPFAIRLRFIIHGRVCFITEKIYTEPSE